MEIRGYCENPECCGREFTLRIKPNLDWGQQALPQALTCSLCMSEIPYSTISTLTRSELSKDALMKAAFTIAEARVSRRKRDANPGEPVAFTVGEIADEAKAILAELSEPE